MVKYYEKIERSVWIENPEVIPLLLHMRWFGQPTSSDIYLKINHPLSNSCSANIIDTRFHKVLWDDVDDSRRTPFRKARLRLEGKQLNELAARPPEVEIFAIMELNIDRPKEVLKIIFSPVPFGIDGKPKLIYDTQTMLIFLRLASVIFRFSKSADLSLKALEERLVMEPDISSYVAADCWIAAFERLGFILRKGDQVSFLRNADQFEQIFGIRLP